MDEMPRLHPADPIDFFPNGSTQSEETSQPCSSSDEMPVGNFNGIPKIVSVSCFAFCFEFFLNSLESISLVFSHRSGHFVSKATQGSGIQNNY